MESRVQGDFTATPAMLRLVALAVPIGCVGALVAVALLDLIGLITNALYHGRLGTSLSAPDGRALWGAAALLPVAGGLVIGAMARFGSEQIRGHGIPEAMENILVRGSRVQPRLAVLKPISSAVSIGTGGPFGAEGPIILTGGALGSLVGQFLTLSAAERKTLLVAGAAAGMSGVFGTPAAAVMLGVELLLFEWKPRSMVPVAVAAAVAAAVRMRLADADLIGAAPLFPVPAHGAPDERALLSALVIGVAGGLLAWLLTAAVYGAEDLFRRLPLHWAWWPAIGGAVVGLGGLIEPRALGVGYASLHAELVGGLAIGALLSLLLVKLVVWSVALGSGTSGGILAPLLIMGAALGGVVGTALPGGGPSQWALLGMTATMAGVMRSPFTSVLFALELTRDLDALLPLLVAATAAHAVSVLVLRRSILTEKVARRGVHVSREYAVDPLEALHAEEVMLARPIALRAGSPVADALDRLGAPDARRQRLYPVVDDAGRLRGVVTWGDLSGADAGAPVGEVARPAVAALADEPLRAVADRMVAGGVGAVPVVGRRDGMLRGLLTEAALMGARVRLLEEERDRRVVLGARARARAPSGAGRR
ncbi:MAG: chloride channel protein [Thermoleophilia bacterium]